MFMIALEEQQLDIVKRVQARLDDLGMSWAEFARRIGTTDQRVYNWRKRGIPKKEVDTIASILDCTTDWLLLGRKTDKNHKVFAKNIEPGPEIQGYVPLISWVSAGEWTTVEDPYAMGDAEKWMPCPVSHGDKTFVLRVRGESMEPEYRDGDLIFVDPNRAAVNGSHVVVRLENDLEATFKKLVIEGDQQYLMAINPSWPNRIIEIDGKATIVGVVIFSGKLRV